MSDIIFIALIMGLGIGISCCCFCLYFLSSCLIRTRTDNSTIIREPTVLEIKVIQNPMHCNEDPTNI